MWAGDGRTGSCARTSIVEPADAASQGRGRTVAEAPLTAQDLLKRWRAQTGAVAGAEELTFDQAAMGPGGKPIELKLLGADMATLDAAVEETKAHLRTYPGVYDLFDDSRPGKWELQMKVKPEAAALGVQLADLANTVRSHYYGDEAMRLQRGRHEVKLMVRYPPDERDSFANLDEIRVRTPRARFRCPSWRRSPSSRRIRRSTGSISALDHHYGQRRQQRGLTPMRLLEISRKASWPTCSSAIPTWQCVGKGKPNRRRSRCTACMSVSWPRCWRCSCCCRWSSVPMANRC